VIRVEMQKLERLKRRDEKLDLTAAFGGRTATVAGAMRRNEAGYDVSRFQFKPTSHTSKTATPKLTPTKGPRPSAIHPERKTTATMPMTVLNQFMY
jgi:hypothetical protein